MSNETRGHRTAGQAQGPPQITTLAGAECWLKVYLAAIPYGWDHCAGHADRATAQLEKRLARNLTHPVTIL